MTISRSRRAGTGAAMGLLLVAACNATAGRKAEAETLGKRFCAAVLAGNEDAAVTLMAAELQDEVAKLKAFDAGWRMRNPGEKPPLGEGLKLTAWQDAAQSCTPKAVRGAEVVLAYAPASAPADVWQDRLMLVQRDEGLVMEDIRYDPRTGGSFRAWVDGSLRSAG
ncbi:hypothetical protein [Thermaurantiacus sp.]